LIACTARHVVSAPESHTTATIAKRTIDAGHSASESLQSTALLLGLL
jgi:hypothetical protein